MKKAFTISLVALLAAGTAGISSAEARPGHGHAYGHYRGHGPGVVRYGYAPRYGYYRHRRGVNGGAIAAGVAGAIIGGAIASQAPRAYYADPYYGY
jgi:hypothetical protein